MSVTEEKQDRDPCLKTEIMGRIKDAHFSYNVVS